MNDAQARLSKGQGILRQMERLKARRDYGHRIKEFNRWRGRSNAPRRYRPIVEPDLTVELGDLDLPIIMPGERPGDPYVAPPSADWRDGLYFRPDGTQIAGMDLHAVLELEHTHWSEKLIATTALFRGGVRMWISTIFRGEDCGTTPLPLLWETMIFVGCRDYRPSMAMDWQWRYASREAARYGHRVIVRRLRSRASVEPVTDVDRLIRALLGHE